MIGQLTLTPNSKKEIKAVCTSTWLIRPYEVGRGYETGILWLSFLELERLDEVTAAAYWIKNPTREVYGWPYRMTNAGRVWIGPKCLVAVEMIGDYPTGFVRFFDTPEKLASVMEKAG